MNLKKLGQKIYAMRRSRDMTQRQLGEIVGQSGSSVSMYERGERMPDIETLEAFADVFNVPLSAFIEEDPADVRKRLENELNGGIQKPESTLTDADLAKIASVVQVNSEAPRTVEARIVSFGMDRLPQEDRERLLAMIRAMYSNRPDLFDNKKGEDNEG